MKQIDYEEFYEIQKTYIKDHIEKYEWALLDNWLREQDFYDAIEDIIPEYPQDLKELGEKYPDFEDELIIMCIEKKYLQRMPYDKFSEFFDWFNEGDDTAYEELYKEYGYIYCRKCEEHFQLDPEERTKEISGDFYCYECIVKISEEKKKAEEEREKRRQVRINKSTVVEVCNDNEREVLNKLKEILLDSFNISVETEPLKDNLFSVNLIVKKLSF